MYPTLYLADTCSLRDADMRLFWKQNFFTQPDRKLTILCTVRYELERQRLQPEHQQEAQGALDFLNKNSANVIYLPEHAGFTKGSVADREIFYHCALRQKGQTILYTADKKLAEAVLLINPLVEVCYMHKGKLTPVTSRWSKVCTKLTEKYCFYLTAACVNSPAFAALMQQPGIAPLFRGKMILSTASLPLLTEQGKAMLQELELQGLAPFLLAQGRICVEEKDELIARLLTHNGKRPAVVLLADEDTLSDYTELSRIPLPALAHTGYTVGVLKGNGRISMQQELDPVDDAPMPEPTPRQETEPLPPAEPKTQEQQPAPAVPEKEQVRQWVLGGNIKKAGAMIANNEALMLHAVYTCFREDSGRLPSILNSLSQRKKLLPAKCFAAYVGTFLPTSADELNNHFKDKVFISALKRLISGSVSLKECKTAMDTLQRRMNQADEPTRAVLQMLIKCAVANGAPEPGKK